MSKKIAFLLDTGSSFRLINDNDCYILPINICIQKNGQETNYQEEYEIDRNHVYNFINEGCKIKTAQPNIGLTLEKMKELVNQYDLIVAIPFTKHLSKTYEMYKTCANEINKNKIVVLDSHPMSLTGNWLVNEIKDLNNKNIEINQKLLDKLAKKYRDNQCGVVIVNDLKQLIEGGRLTGIKGLLAKALKLKLAIMYQGDLNLCAKDLNIEGAINKSIDEINKKIHFTKRGINRVIVFPDLKDESENQKYVNYLKNKLKVNNVEYALLPSSVVTHTGTNTFSFIIESK